MVRVASVSIKGSSHEKNGLPCQDYSLVHLVENGSTVICALSDGAGSAKYAAEAAQLQVEETIDYFKALLSDHPAPIDLIQEFDKSDGVKLLEIIRDKISKKSEDNHCTINDYSATLLFCILHPNCSVFYQLGDGCWVIRKNNIYCNVTKPTQGEFVGQTVFAVSSTYLEDLQFDKINTGIDTAIGFTDGIERLALDVRSSSPSSRFFNPIVEMFLSEEKRYIFEDKIAQFFQSERVCDRTDDDKSIILVANGIL
jgi:hypothetical protein